MATRRTSRKQTRTSSKQSPGGSDLLAQELQQIHSAESQLARALPKFAKVVESNALRRMMKERIAQGERLIDEVAEALEELDGGAPRGKNTAAEGLIGDTQEHMQRIKPGPALDAVLTAGMQKTEHYCIAAWGTAKSLAEATGQRDAVKAMDRALKEGKALDKKLTQIAERELTPTLMTEESDEEVRSTRSRSRRKRTRH
jgi:ferritin-like metal-binding protein YciE